MVSTLIPDLAEITVARLQQELDARPDGLPPDVVPDFLLACDLVAQAFENFHARVAAELEKGVEARSLHHLILLNGIPRANIVVGLCGLLRARIPPSELAHLSAAVERIERVRAEFVRLAAWLAPGPPPAGVAALQLPPAESRAGYQSIADVRARLKFTGGL